jgi:hypothetical protein
VLFLSILWNVVAPIFLIMVLGFVVQRGVGFDIRSLTKLNFWVFVPAFLFVKFVKSDLSGEQMGAIVAHFCVFFPLLGILTWWISGLLKMRDRLRRAFTASVIFYNSGNYGVPVSKLAFGATGESVQAIVIVLQNLTNFSIGLGLHAGARDENQEAMSWREQITAIGKMPMIYTFVAALLFRLAQWPIPAPVDHALTFLADGLVPIALVTLGAQMATLKSYRFTGAMALTLFLRLAFAPLLGFAVVRLLRIEGEVGKLLILSTSFPTAVNAALLAIEYENEPDYASAVVFYSTIASAFSVSLVIFLLRIL